MKVLICPDSFKGTFSAKKTAELMSRGVLRNKDMQVELLPIADGGEGTLDIFSSLNLIRIHEKRVRNPLGKKVNAIYGIFKNKKTALIETSQAVGLPLVPVSKRNPMYTTSYGIGELIKAALDNKCDKIILTIGGSSTNDAGMGMLQNLGFRFLDSNKKEISLNKAKGYCGKSLAYLSSIDVSKIDKRLKQTKFIVASDVNNPLYGKKGAAFVYAAQKGASKKDIILLDKYLRNFANVVKKSLGKDISNVKGAGAAGGLGSGIYAFLDAHIVSGIDFILKTVEFEKYVKKSDIIMTGEGRIDSQTDHGKAIAGVIKITKKNKKPIIAIGGCLGKGYEKLVSKFAVIYDSSLGKRKSLLYYNKNSQLISNAAYKAMKIYLKKEAQ